MSIGIHSIAYDPTHQRLASLSADDDIRIWSLTGELLYTIPESLISDEEYFSLSAIRFSPDGSHLLLKDSDHNLRLLDFAQQKVIAEHIKSYNPASNWQHCLIFDDPQRILLSADQKVHVFDHHLANIKTLPSNHEEEAYYHCQQDGQHYLCVKSEYDIEQQTETYGIEVFSTDTGELIAHTSIVQKGGSSTLKARLNNNQVSIAMLSYNNINREDKHLALYQWDWQQDKLDTLGEITEPCLEFDNIFLETTATALIVAAGNSLFVYDALPNPEIKHYPFPSAHYVTKEMCTSPDNAMLFLILEPWRNHPTRGKQENHLQLFKFDPSELSYEQYIPSQPLQQDALIWQGSGLIPLSKDSFLLATSLRCELWQDKKVQRYFYQDRSTQDQIDPTELFKDVLTPFKPVRDPVAVLSPNADLALVTGSNNQFFNTALFDRQGNLIKPLYNRFQMHSGERATFSNDGSLVAIDYSHHYLAIHNIATGECLATLDDEDFSSRTMETLKFSPDGRCIALANTEGRVYIWPWMDGGNVRQWNCHPINSQQAEWKAEGYTDGDMDDCAEIYCIDWFQCSHKFLAATATGIYQWDLEQDSISQVKAGECKNVAIWQTKNSADLSYAVTDAEEGLIFIYDKQWEEIDALEDRAYSDDFLRFSNDGKRILSPEYIHDLDSGLRYPIEENGHTHQPFSCVDSLVWDEENNTITATGNPRDDDDEEYYAYIEYGPKQADNDRQTPTPKASLWQRLREKVSRDK